jgi:hypothetical protein
VPTPPRRGSFVSSSGYVRVSSPAGPAPSPGEHGPGTSARLAGGVLRRRGAGLLTALTEPRTVVFRRAIAQRIPQPGGSSPSCPAGGHSPPRALMGLAAAVAPYLARRGGRARARLLAAAVSASGTGPRSPALLSLRVPAKRADAATLLYCGLLYGARRAPPRLQRRGVRWFYPWLGPAVVPGAVRRSGHSAPRPPLAAPLP